MASSSNTDKMSTLECLKHVREIGKTVFMKRVATTQLGRRKLSNIYNKMRLTKEQKSLETKKKRGTYCQYDKDGNGDARFLEAYLLMFKEGYNCSKASKKVVGPTQQQAFRQAFGTCAFCTVFCVCTIVFLLLFFQLCFLKENKYLLLFVMLLCIFSQELQTDFQRQRD